MKTGPIVVAVAAALTLASCAPAAISPGAGAPAPTSAVPSPPVSGPGEAAPKIRIYQEPHFAGGGGFMTPAFDQLKAMADAHPTVFSGSWFNPANPRQLVIGVVLPHDPAAVKLEALRRELDPEQKATKTVPAKYSWAQLQQMQQWVLVHYMEPSKYGIQGLGPDQIGEALHVTIYRTNKDPALDQNPAVIALAAKYGDAVEFEETAYLVSAVTG